MGTQYFNMHESQVVLFLEANNIKLDKTITLEVFLRLFEQNESHVLFKWFHDLSKDYTGTLNAQFDPTEEQVKVSARISPTTRKEI